MFNLKYLWNKSDIFTGCYSIKTVVFTAWKIKGIEAMSRISCSVQDFKNELKTEENINKKKIYYCLRWIWNLFQSETGLLK